jgi:hypothetical protein
MKPTRDDLLAVIRELADKAVPKVAQRNAAYAGSGDVFGNLNLVETLSNGRLSTELGITLRMGDKVSRLYSLCSDPTIDPTDEPLEDTLIDLLGYSALLLLRHRTRTSPPTKKTSPCNFTRERQVVDLIKEKAKKYMGDSFPHPSEKELIPKLHGIVGLPTHAEDVQARVTQTIKDFRKENPGELEEFVHRLPVTIPDAESPPPMTKEHLAEFRSAFDGEFKVEYAGTPEVTPFSERHLYAWDGHIPCTGSYRCLYCKKVADVTGTDYSKVDYTERCPARTKGTPS